MLSWVFLPNPPSNFPTTASKVYPVTSEQPWLLLLLPLLAMGKLIILLLSSSTRRGKGKATSYAELDFAQMEVLASDPDGVAL